ncbi:MAG: cytochrome [Pseudonocardiales bacterium]|nr:cytochrome [Pseudonocardiales bacterium]
MDGFDHHSEAFARNWRHEYARLRDEEPVSRTDAHGGYVVVTRYDHVKQALLNPRTFVCRREVTPKGAPEAVVGGVTIPTNPFRMGMMEMDPPDATFFRKLLVPWFSARAVEAAESHLGDLVTWCLDRVITSGRMDVVDDLANPLPALIMLDLLGLPMQNWSKYGVVLHQAAYREKGSARQIAWLQGDLRQVLTERRDHPPEISTPVDALLGAEHDGRPLPLDVAAEMVFMLLTGGIDTSTGLIAHAVCYLSAHPEQRDRLIADPELIPGAADEMLRYFSPGTGVARTAVEDTELGDAPIRAGERVFLALGSANGDPDEFAEPDRLELTREANRHLAFGAGLHRCLGAFLAKAELVLLLRETLRRMPDLHVDESGVRAYPTIPLISGFQAMPATFTPGPVVGPMSGANVPPPRAERLRRAAAELATDGAESGEEVWQPTDHEAVGGHR